MTDDIVLPDDTTRPEPFTFEDLSDKEMEPRRHLAMIHDHQRENMRALRELIDKAHDGTLSPEALNAATDDLEMLDNYRRFGTLCGQHCQIVHTHHAIEDSYVFPALSAKAEVYRRIIARLTEEHDIVHALILRLIGELRALIDDPSETAFETAVATYEKFEGLLLSHFSYEERAIGPALGRYRIGV